MTKLLGVVRDNRFIPLEEAPEAKRLTAIAPQAAVPPDSAELSLATIEGKTVYVEGDVQGDWVYSARVASAQFFRANVGIVLMNEQGQVLALERVPQGSAQWQMPQGGLDELEEPREAVMRELFEEIGLGSDKVELVREHPEWLAYELPPEARSAKHGRGQVQKWFLFRFRGEDADIDISGRGSSAEFARFRWMKLSDLAEQVWEVRRPVYRRLAGDFELRHSC